MPVLSDLPERVHRRISRRRAQQRLERDFAALMETRSQCASSRAGTGPTVAFATFGSGPWHLALEALLAHALSLRGAVPELLVCDLPELPICDERTCLLREPLRCPGCISEKRALLDASSLRWRRLSEFVPAPAIRDAASIVEHLPDDAVEDYVHDGWPLGRWTYVSACHFLRGDARAGGPAEIAIRRRFVQTAIVIVAAAERWLDTTKPDIVIAESGAHFMWRIVVELARARGIRTVCREIGKGGWDVHIYSLNAECMFPQWTDTWSAARGVPLSAIEEARVDAYMAGLASKTFRRDGPALQDVLPDAARHALGLDTGRPMAVCFTNVVWDLASAGRDVAFDGMFDWLAETLRLARDTPGVDFVIRIHPAEASVPTRERALERIGQSWPMLPPNVRLLGPESPLSARSLFHAAELVVTYCSTVAIEAAAEGRRVAVCGAPHYRGRGFTIDIETKNAYAGMLRLWSAGALEDVPSSWRDNARRYAHLFFLRYHIEMGWTTSPLEPPYRLKLASLAQLEPGRSAAVDAVCAGILHGREIVMPAIRPDEASHVPATRSRRLS